MIEVKRQPLEAGPESVRYISGKLVIIGVLAVALSGAAASWCYRYYSTHRAAEFWGPETARLIRDAPRVLFCENNAPIASKLPAKADLGSDLAPEHRKDISRARGLTHLRNALLEDRGFDWSRPAPTPLPSWKWVLIFSDENVGGAILFSSDCKYAAAVDNTEKIVSCEPISEGLIEMFDEFRAEAANEPR
jgi:hypothetical protein